MLNTVIGIAGGTGSGKTTVAEAILHQFTGKSIVLIHQDSYYKDLCHLSPGEREKINFDHPDALDDDLLVSHIKDLKEGRTIYKPVYDFKIHMRSKEMIPVESMKVILLEGILVLGDKRLRELMDIKLYVDTDPDIRFIRRLERDMEDRGRTLQSVIEQYSSTVRPMHFEFVETTRRYADLIIPEGGHNSIAIDMVVSKIRSIISND
ncbi:MAG: uridine kinase [Nitrospirota bacterium]